MCDRTKEKRVRRKDTKLQMFVPNSIAYRIVTGPL